MNIKLELIKKDIAAVAASQVSNIEIDADKIADSTAINALEEIQRIISNEDNTDFEAVEQIVCVFEKYGLDFGGRHDF